MKRMSSKSYLDCLNLSVTEKEILMLVFSEAPEEMKKDLIEDYCRECWLYGRKWWMNRDIMKKKLLGMPLERWTLDAKSLNIKAVFNCPALKVNLYMAFPDKRARLTSEWQKLQRENKMDISLYELFFWAETDDSLDWNDVRIEIKEYN